MDPSQKEFIPILLGKLLLLEQQFLPFLELYVFILIEILLTVEGLVSGLCRGNLL